MCIAGCDTSKPGKKDAGSTSTPAGSHTATCPLKSPYDGVDPSKDIESYNCAGLAHRTYTKIGLNDTKTLLENKGTKADCSKTCAPCQVKHWFWEYDVYVEDADGNTLFGPNHDFHTVAGQVGPDGKEPTNVYSKNGSRPLEGPGTGASFKPKAKDEARSNDRRAEIGRGPDGRPIYKVRKNMVETCYCLPPP